jgi:hypothetical protein
MALPLMVNGDIDGPATARRALEASGAGWRDDRPRRHGAALAGGPQVSAALTGRSWTPPSAARQGGCGARTLRWLLSAWGATRACAMPASMSLAYIEEARRQAGRISPGEAARLLTSECPQTVRAGLVEAFLSSTPETSERMRAA